MVRVRTLACLFAIPYNIASQPSDFDEFFDTTLSLLQLRSSALSPTTLDQHQQHNSSNFVGRVKSRDPGASERAMCPHEIEAAEAARGDFRFGCAGAMRAQSTVKCSIWGEPHITQLFTGGIPSGNIDVLYKSGLWRMGAAADGSWEVQLFNCGVYASAVAARFGKSLIEVFVDQGGRMRYYLNGAEVSLPAEGLHGVKLDTTHRSIHRESHHIRAPAHLPGTCADDPGGQINIDIAHDLNDAGNLNVKIEAAADSVTTLANDRQSICNVNARIRNWRWANWETPEVAPQDSLFTIGNQMCAGCNGRIGWGRGRRENQGSEHAARNTCNAAQARDVEEVTLESICRGHNIAVADAANACAALADTPRFFQDCQVDYCASDGQVVAVEEAIGEEALENPQPQCAGGGDCDPASKCCNALRDGSTLKLDNVVQSDLCSGGQVRYGGALTQNGQSIDLVVKAVGGVTCTSKLTDAKFGSKSEELGYLAVTAGTSQEFEFSFVATGTETPVAPSNLMMSFLDLDQGKKNKQRESVEVCGNGAAITTDDTELEIQVNGDCVQVTSTTAGTGADNPSSVESMSQLQRARTAAFEVTGSKFTTTLSVTKKGHNPRRFLFAGHPSVACVLQ